MISAIMDEDRWPWLRLVLKVLAVVVIVGLLLVAAGLRAQLNRQGKLLDTAAVELAKVKHDQDQSRQGKSPASTDRLRYQAEQFYFRCHPADALTDPVEIRLCERYDTLEHAYAAQGTTSPTP